MMTPSRRDKGLAVEPNTARQRRTSPSNSNSTSEKALSRSNTSCATTRNSSNSSGGGSCGSGDHLPHFDELEAQEEEDSPPGLLEQGQASLPLSPLVSFPLSSRRGDKKGQSKSNKKAYLRRWRRSCWKTRWPSLTSTKWSCSQRAPLLLIQLLFLVVVMVPLCCFVLLWLYFYFMYPRQPIHGPSASNSFCPTTWADVQPTCHHLLMHQQQNNNSHSHHRPGQDNNNNHQQKRGKFLNATQWLRLRQLYMDSTTTTTTTITSSSCSMSLAEGWEDPTNTGWQVPVDFKYSPGQGRGVYAAASTSSSSITNTTTAGTIFIPKGTKLWDSRYRGVFYNECAAQIFFSHLSNEERCDVMFWGYSNNHYSSSNSTRGDDDPDPADVSSMHSMMTMKFMIDLDGHGYLNHCDPNTAERTAEHHFENERETGSTQYGWPHILSYPLPRSRLWEWWWRYWRWSGLSSLPTPSILNQRNIPGSHGLYASRDILPGEQICFDYAEVHMNAILDYHNMMFQRALKVYQWSTK